MGRLCPPLLGDKTKDELERELAAVRQKKAEVEARYDQLKADEKDLEEALRDK